MYQCIKTHDTNSVRRNESYWNSQHIAYKVITIIKVIPSDTITAITPTVSINKPPPITTNSIDSITPNIFFIIIVTLNMPNNTYNVMPVRVCCIR